MDPLDSRTARSRIPTPDCRVERGRSRRRALHFSPLPGAALLVALAWVGMVGAAADEDTSTSARPTDASAVEAPIPRLPVEVTERVRYWMKRFQTDQRSSFESFLSREGLYGSLIREKLRARGMPEELLYLAMIESGFSTGATSDVAAVGLWQLMGPTAREYGLRVDLWVDERRDPLEATDAALDYLGWLYERYGSWYLAAAAYNAGPGRVDRALRRGGASPATRSGATPADAGDENLYWEVQHDLPPETREHVPRLLAATLLARGSERGQFEISPSRPYEFDRVWVPGGTSLAVVARSVGAKVALLRDLNPHLVRDVTPPGASYALRVPVGTTHQVVAALSRGLRGGSRRADD
jgi:membrane-bound lytic murein transglycosylase D